MSPPGQREADGHRAEVCAGAHHGSAQEPRTALYDAGAAKRHWVALLDLFGRLGNR